MPFDYEKSIWGRGEASLNWGDPTAFRLKQSLEAVKTLPAGARVLEVGSGAGQFIRAIKRIHPEFECLGCDISLEALEAAKKANDGVHYQLCDDKRLPYEDRSVDAVLIFDVLEHVPYPSATLNEASRILKTGGVLYAFVPCEGDWLSLWHWLDVVGLKKSLTKKYAGHIQYFTRRSLFDFARQAGFKISKIHYSEHLIGQILGIAAFVMMDRAARRQNLKQINNEEYFDRQNSGWLNFVKRRVNSLVYFESLILGKIPSPNVHLILVKSAD